VDNFITEVYLRTFKESAGFSEKVADTFLRWSRLQVNHFVALNTLSTTFCSLTAAKPPEIFILAGKHPLVKKNIPKVELWRVAIKDLVIQPPNNTKPLNPNMIIATLESHIQKT
jgi:hypothetical protein